MQLKGCISWHFRHVRQQAFIFLQALMFQWDLSTEIIIDPLWYKDKKKNSYIYIYIYNNCACCLPEDASAEMENRLPCQSLSSSLDSRRKWRWPQPWTGRACRWDRRRPRRDPEHFQKPLLGPRAGSACTPSQHPAPAAQQTAWGRKGQYKENNRAALNQRGNITLPVSFHPRRLHMLMWHAAQEEIEACPMCA